MKRVGEAASAAIEELEMRPATAPASIPADPYQIDLNAAQARPTEVYGAIAAAVVLLVVGFTVSAFWTFSRLAVARAIHASLALLLVLAIGALLVVAIAVLTHITMTRKAQRIVAAAKSQQELSAATRLAAVIESRADLLMTRIWRFSVATVAFSGVFAGGLISYQVLMGGLF